MKQKVDCFNWRVAGQMRGPGVKRLPLLKPGEEEVTDASDWRS